MSARTSAGTVEIARGVHWLPILGTNVYFVRSGESWVLIDTGFPGSGRIIAESAKRLCGAAGRPGSILITHGHPDHVGSAVGLAAAWNVPILAPAAEMPFMDGTALYPEPLVAWLARLLPPRAMAAHRRDAAASVVALADLDPWVLATGHGTPFVGAPTAPALRAFAARCKRADGSDQAA